MNMISFTICAFWKKEVILLQGFLLLFIALNAQQNEYFNEQSSEVAPIIIRYNQDVRTLRDYYSPRATRGFSYQSVLNSPTQRNRLKEINALYLNELQSLSFDQLHINGQVDYLLLKNKIASFDDELEEEERQYQKITPLIPFADSIYMLEKTRLRGGAVQGQKIAEQLHKISEQLHNDLENIDGKPKLDIQEATFGQNAVHALQARLENVYTFYNGYDPLFTWWVPKTYTRLDSLLGKYAEALKDSGEIAELQKPDDSGITGIAVGLDALSKQLSKEFIPYTPQELIRLANQEFQWCDRELLKASNEMGFGDNWKSAQEQVKNSYVEPGKQPELIVKLYDDAKSFITERDWITWPELADETWGMIMMTPERQLVNPFFTGGREISISYPTNSMSHEDKMMSMRGNNPYFSRGTVQHELIPGHHLQYFMNSRYKPYRTEFRTPFYTEGWALYWELLLYENGFAKTPEERIGMLFWRMHRCARIIFSLNYHLGQWSPQECIDFLVDRVGFERTNAEGEVRRSFQGNYPPLYQAAYLLGGIQIMELKRELVDSGKMSLKEFHDAVMKENQMPIELMRAVLSKQKLSKDFETSWKFYDFK